jgi:hypothetical protein
MFRFLVARHAQCWILISNSRSQLKGYVTVLLCCLPWVGLMRVLSLVGLSVSVGRVVDTSMFLRTVASPETLNGYNRWKPGLERCLCVLEVLTIAG